VERDRRTQPGEARDRVEALQRVRVADEIVDPEALDACDA
jgi:hypothetical protein